MAANLKDDEERFRRMQIIYQRFIQTNESTRQIAKYISNSEDYNFKISHVTVSKYLKDIRKYLNQDDLEELDRALEDKKEKTIDDPLVKERVLKCAKSCLIGNTIEETAAMLESTYWQVYRDLQYRLKQIDNDVYEKVKEKLIENSRLNISKR